MSGDVTIGAIEVGGIDGAALLEAVVETWNAEVVVKRTPRNVNGTTGWALLDKGNGTTVVYLRENVVYLVSIPTIDPIMLHTILSAMPTVTAADPTPLSPAQQLLATLPTEAGGVHFDSYQIIDDSLNYGLAVDDVLVALGKKRRDAVSVSRSSADASISATLVEGIDGAALLKAFVETWDSRGGAVVRRSQRVIAVSLTAWELERRDGWLTVMYQLGDVVYLVGADDRHLLDAILLDMPLKGP